MQHDTFNADFYVVAATVIPLLYITLTLQGTTYEKLLKHMKSSYDDPGSSWVSWPNLIFQISRWSLFFYLSYLVSVAGIMCEVTAISALYTRSASTFFQVATLLSTWLLIFAIGIDPAQRFIAANRSRAHKTSEDTAGQPSD